MSAEEMLFTVDLFTAMVRGIRAGVDAAAPVRGSVTRAAPATAVSDTKLSNDVRPQTHVTASRINTEVLHQKS